MIVARGSWLVVVAVVSRAQVLRVGWEESRRTIVCCSLRNDCEFESSQKVNWPKVDPVRHVWPLNVPWILNNKKSQGSIDKKTRLVVCSGGKVSSR